MADRARPGKLLAIDWDARTLRVVHASLGRRRRARVEKMFAVAVPPDVDTADPSQIGALIRTALDQEQITTRHAVVDVPRTEATLNTLHLPITVPEELPGIVNIQIAKELPFPIAEAVVDFAVAPTESGTSVGEVLVAAIRREVLTRYEATFAAAGLKLDRVGLRPYANRVAVVELLKPAVPERALLIDVGATFTEIDIIRNGFLAFSRAASVAVGPVQDDPPPALSIAREPDDDAGTGDMPLPAALGRDSSISSLLIEVTRSLEAYRAHDPGARMDYCIIAGDAGVESRLADAVQSRMGIQAELYNPARCFGWSPDDGVEAGAFSATLGLVLAYGDEGALQFDFLHPKRAVSATQKRLRKAPLAAAVGLLFVTAAGVAVAGITRPDRERLAKIEKRIKELEKDADDYKKFLKFVDEVRSFDADQFVWVDELYDVVTLMPPGEEFVVNHLEMNQRDGRLVLKTRAKQRDTAMELLRKLEEFRRDGRDRPRFKVSMGPQAEKKGEKYPFIQDLRITVLDDTPTKLPAKPSDAAVKKSGT